MLNGIQVGTIGRQEEDLMTVFLSDGFKGLSFVESGMVKDQD